MGSDFIGLSPGRFFKTPI